MNFPPLSVRVFNRCGELDDIDVYAIVGKTAFNRCSKLEQQFIVWRQPAMRYFEE